MGLVVVLIGVGILTLRNWEFYSPESAREKSLVDRLAAAAERPAVWTLAFIVVAVAAGLATIGFISGSLPSGVQSAAGLVVGLVFATLFLFFIFQGCYRAARSWGMKSSQAAAIGSWALGLLLLVVITVLLLIG